MAFVPTAKIYASDGVSLVYNIGNMLDIQGWPNDEEPDSVSLTNLRGQGEINISGGNKSFDIIITGRLSVANYTALISAWNSLQSTIALHTAYYLKIDTSVSTTDPIKVKRIAPIEIIRTNNMNTWLYYNLTLRALSWT